VVEEDANLAVIAAGVAESVLDLGLIVSRGAGEDVVTHGHADAALKLDLVVVVDAVSPALAAVDGESSILLVAVGNDLTANKVGHSLLAGGAELVLGGLGGLEQNVRVAVGVQLAGSLAGRADVVTTVLVDLGDLLDGGSPVLLDLKDLRLSHWGGANMRRG